MTTTIEPQVCAEGCGRSDGTHDPECPVHARALDALRAAVAPAAIDYSKPHQFVPEPVGDDEEPIDQCSGCTKRELDEIHTSVSYPVLADTLGVIEELTECSATLRVSEHARVHATLKPGAWNVGDTVNTTDVVGDVDPISDPGPVIVDGQPAKIVHGKSEPIIKKKTLIEAMAEVAKHAEKVGRLKDVEAEKKKDFGEAKDKREKAETELAHAQYVALDAYRREKLGTGQPGEALVLGEEAQPT